MEGSYFDYLPKDIIYLILENFDTLDIFRYRIIGYKFYDTDRSFFEKLLKRDFGDEIKTELIVYTKGIPVYNYGNFLVQYNTMLKGIPYRHGSIFNLKKLRLNTSFITSKFLSFIGINLPFRLLDIDLGLYKFSIYKSNTIPISFTLIIYKESRYVFCRQSSIAYESEITILTYTNLGYIISKKFNIFLCLELYSILFCNVYWFSSDGPFRND